MTSTPTSFDGAVDELSQAVARISEADIDRLVRCLAQARHVCVYGCGREALQIRGFAMRLFHLGRSVSVVGDITMPPIGPGDVFVVTAGPGSLPTALALTAAARRAGALVSCVTADPEGAVPRMADEILLVPAQTMVTDQGDERAALPMGSVYEGALFLLFEIVIQKLQRELGVADADMRARHTNLE